MEKGGKGVRTILAQYTYLGRGTIVVEDYESADVELTYLDGSGNVTGLDRFGRVVDQIWTDYGADPDEVIDRYTYTYDRAGNRLTRANALQTALSETYSYNALNELISTARNDNFDQSWTLDGLGNFSTFDDDGISQDRTTNAANEIQSISGTWVTPVYDAAGNMISGPKPGDETTRVHYVYDAWNRLVAVKADDSGSPGATLAEYSYDGRNRRIEKVVTGTSDVHYYYNEQWQMLEERFVDGNGETTASNQYVWSARYIDSPVVRFHDGNGDGDCIPSENDPADTICYYTGDANYNVTTTITIGYADGNTTTDIEHYVYGAYGEATVYSSTWTALAAPSVDGPLYAGYFFDAETGQYQVRNRYYDSSTSTFTSRDPKGFAAGDANLTRYCGNGPTNRLDPTGLDQFGSVIRRPPVPGCPMTIQQQVNLLIWQTTLPRPGDPYALLNIYEYQQYHYQPTFKDRCDEFSGAGLVCSLTYGPAIGGLLIAGPEAAGGALIYEGGGAACEVATSAVDAALMQLLRTQLIAQIARLEGQMVAGQAALATASAADKPLLQYRLSQLMQEFTNALMALKRLGG